MEDKKKTILALLTGLTEEDIDGMTKQDVIDFVEIQKSKVDAKKRYNQRIEGDERATLAYIYFETLAKESSLFKTASKELRKKYDIRFSPQQVIDLEKEEKFKEYFHLLQTEDFKEICKNFCIPSHFERAMLWCLLTGSSERFLNTPTVIRCGIRLNEEKMIIKKSPIPHWFIEAPALITQEELLAQWEQAKQKFRKDILGRFNEQGWDGGFFFDRALRAHIHCERGLKGGEIIDVLGKEGFLKSGHPSEPTMHAWRRKIKKQVEAIQNPFD